jgi:hypothetical protein
MPGYTLCQPGKEGWHLPSLAEGAGIIEVQLKQTFSPEQYLPGARVVERGIVELELLLNVFPKQYSPGATVEQAQGSAPSAAGVVAYGYRPEPAGSGHCVIVCSF